MLCKMHNCDMIMQIILATMMNMQLKWGLKLSKRRKDDSTNTLSSLQQERIDKGGTYDGDTALPYSILP